MDETQSQDTRKVGEGSGTGQEWVVNLAMAAGGKTGMVSLTWVSGRVPMSLREAGKGVKQPVREVSLISSVSD